jgi:hypothetical protein
MHERNHEAAWSREIVTGDEVREDWRTAWYCA